MDQSHGIDVYNKHWGTYVADIDELQQMIGVVGDVRDDIGTVHLQGFVAALSRENNGDESHRCEIHLFVVLNEAVIAVYQKVSEENFLLNEVSFVRWQYLLNDRMTDRRPEVKIRPDLNLDLLRST